MTLNDLNLHGIKLNSLTDFIEDKGGREALKDFTTHEVCEKFVKKATEINKSSYCDLLRSQNNPALGEKANVFLSHAWSYKFVDVVDALFEHFDKDEEKDKIIIWFDVFSVNQHATNEKKFEWWNITFKEAIRDIGRTVMVLTPWNDPLPLKRAWCILELYFTSITNAKFEVAMSKTVREAFINDLEKMKGSAVLDMLANINSKNSKCTKDEDKVSIFNLAQTIGFPKLNKMVSEKLRLWVISEVEKQIEKAKEHPRNCLYWEINRGRLYEQQGKLDVAEKIFCQCYKDAPTVFAVASETTLEILHSLVSIYIQQGKHSFAERFIGYGLKTIKKHSLDRALLLRFKNTLAEIYHNQGKNKEALPLAEDCLKGWKKLDKNDNNDNTCTSMSTLAHICFALGQLKRAKSLYTECLEKGIKELVENHPNTWTYMINLATVFHQQRKFKEAKKYFIQAKDGLEGSFGLDHPQTLAALHNLAVVKKEQRKFEEAESLYLQLFELSKERLGENHPNVLRAMYNIAALYDAQRKFEKAEQFYQNSFEKGKQSLGKTHPHTIKSRNDLAEFYLKRGLFQKALPLFRECLDLIDPSTMFEPMLSLARIYCDKMTEFEIKNLLPAEKISRDLISKLMKDKKVSILSFLNQFSH